MLVDFYRQRIEALENANAELRARQIELTEFIYTLVDEDTPKEYKEVVRAEVFFKE
tara:strand:+ start:2209 stop:2376 length:168 start_codon:yes stop_codon:yes gene_type:complete